MTLSNGRTSRPVGDRAILEIASRQHGLIMRRQLIDAGISADAVDRRVRAGRLTTVHRGVYRIGPDTAPFAREMAAVLACGAGAVLGYRTAGDLSRFLPQNGQHPIDVIVRVSRRRARTDIRIHHLHSVTSDEITTLHGIPITTPARTLLDLASCVTHRELERALAEAQALRLVTDSDVLAMMARHPRWPGVGALRLLLESDDQPALTRSEAEERLLALVRKAQLGHPQTNVRVEGYEVDLFWKAERLVVEVDGRSFHTSDPAFERDRRRDAVLMARGIRVIRVTWSHIVNESEALLVTLAQALVR